MKGYIDFSFKLPVCLYLSNERQFPIETEGVIVKTHEIIEHEDRQMGKAWGMEIASDVDAAFRFTEMHVLIKDINPAIPHENLTSVYEPKVIRLANRFIDAYRAVSGRHAIANISSLESMKGFSVKRDDTGLVTISFGAKGSVLTPLKPHHSEDEQSTIADRFAHWEIPLEDQFLMDARRYITIGHDLQALISAVTALDIVVRSYPLQKPRWFFRFWNKYKMLQLMIENALANSPAKEHIGLVKGAIRERNDVIHSGKRNLGGDVTKYVSAIESAIKEIQTIYAQ